MGEERRLGTSGEARVRRKLALGLEEFGRTALETHARSLGVPVGALVGQAALYYLAIRASDRAATRIPRFSRGEAQADATFTVELELEESEWSALEVDSVQRRLSIERLVEHIALLFLADVDSGRVALRIAAEDEEAGF